MKEFATRIYVEGTAARKLEHPTRKQASIISFPETRMRRTRQVARPCRATNTLSERLASILRRSEMACSLLFETCAGCAYHLFTRHQVVFFSCALVSLLALGIVLGV